MKKSAFADFSQSALDTLDFVRCQRANGSFYGTATRCVSGTQVGPREIKAIKAKADAGDAKAKKALEKLASDGDKDAKAALGSPAESKPAPKKEALGSPVESTPAPKEEAPKKPSVGAAEQMSRDELKAVPEGGQVNTTEGTVFQKGDDGNFYMVKEDGELGSLDYKPGEVRQQGIGAASREPRKDEASSTKTTSEPAKTPKGEEGPYKKGQFAPDKDAWKDGEKLEAAAEAWRQRQGLTDETSVHDRVHAGVHSFTGRTSEDLAQMQGQKGVTTTEEILVNLVSGHAAAGGGKIESPAALLSDAKNMRSFFEESEGLTPTQIKRWDRDSRRAVKIFERMSKQDGFDDFISEMEAYSG
jgi:hypothetical protein